MTVSRHCIPSLSPTRRDLGSLGGTRSMAPSQVFSRRRLDVEPGVRSVYHRSPVSRPQAVNLRMAELPARRRQMVAKLPEHLSCPGALPSRTRAAHALAAPSALLAWAARLGHPLRSEVSTADAGRELSTTRPRRGFPNAAEEGRPLTRASPPSASCAHRPHANRHARARAWHDCGLDRALPADLVRQRPQLVLHVRRGFTL